MEKNDPGSGILFITPPFTQLNAPYPATAFLKGFLHTKNIASHQCDLGIEVILALFSPTGFQRLFDEIIRLQPPLSPNARRMAAMREEYTATIGGVIAFLQGRSPELAHRIAGRQWLPEASRFGRLTDLDHDFGELGIHDRAKHLATCYLEDVADLVAETIDPHFGFSRYAERLGRSAATFDELAAALGQPGTLVDAILRELLEEEVDRYCPSLVALSVPFPGNLLGALKCGQWLRKQHPSIKIAMGGGFVSTELRSLTDPRVFSYVDFITLDDGETPLLNLAEHLAGSRPAEMLKRTFLLRDGVVTWCNGSEDPDAAQRDTGTPDYEGLPAGRYLSVMEVANPMHRLWSDGFWNKLMLAHGCYWGKCTFCDVTLDYIKRYEPFGAAVICDRMEAVMAQTGRNGFHFTDEAAPPALMRELALEILRRRLTVVWWTNIRFEKNFTPGLCRLLAVSGCIAVSGGLEVASDRILKLIDKGVTVAQVAAVAGNFTRAGIMVHAYLMYGFPTQTAQETVDALEVVRQLFLNGVVQSGFWHQFAMTAHSPAGLDPARFGVERTDTITGSFANNDLPFTDRTGCDHESFSEGLKKSLYNYMHGICLDFPLQEWFGFRIPRTTVAPGFIRGILVHEAGGLPAPGARIAWLGGMPEVVYHTRQKKGKSMPAARLVVQTRQREVVLNTHPETGRWLMALLPRISPANRELMTFHQLEDSFSKTAQGEFKLFWNSPVMQTLRENGMVVV